MRPQSGPPVGPCGWRGLSVHQLARLAQVPHETISRLQNTQQRHPSLPVAMRLAKALGVTLDYLAGITRKTRRRTTQRKQWHKGEGNADANTCSPTLGAIKNGSYFQDQPTPSLSSGRSWNTSRQPGKPFNLNKPILTAIHCSARRDKIVATSSLQRT
jgi:transcriptional regulator with XRE-family HTH domain